MFKMLFLIFFILFLSSCASKIEYVPYYVPTYCEVELPIRPSNKNDNVLNTISLLEYVEVLEVSIKKCMK